MSADRWRRRRSVEPFGPEDGFGNSPEVGRRRRGGSQPENIRGHEVEEVNQGTEGPHEFRALQACRIRRQQVLLRPCRQAFLKPAKTFTWQAMALMQERQQCLLAHHLKG